MARRARVPTYQGSPMDQAEDAHGASLLGVTPQQYNQTPRDAIQNMVGQRRLNAAVATKAIAEHVIKHHSSGGRKR